MAGKEGCRVKIIDRKSLLYMQFGVVKHDLGKRYIIVLDSGKTVTVNSHQVQ